MPCDIGLQHIHGRKHRKFAADDSNFLQLDFLLGRVRRRTMQEVEDEERDWEERRQRSGCNSDSEQEDEDEDNLGEQFPQDMDQTIRPWDNDDDDDERDADGDVYVDMDD